MGKVKSSKSKLCAFLTLLFIFLFAFSCPVLADEENAAPEENEVVYETSSQEKVEQTSPSDQAFDLSDSLYDQNTSNDHEALIASMDRVNDNVVFSAYALISFAGFLSGLIVARSLLGAFK